LVHKIRASLLNRCKATVLLFKIAGKIWGKKPAKMFRQQTNHFGLGESKKTIWFCREKVKQSAGNLIVVVIRSFGGNPAGG